MSDFKILTKFERPETTHADALATISAGYRGSNRPEASRDGTIHLHDPEGRAPALKAALEARHKKGLTIAFPYDDLADIIHQAFAAYSASALLWKGDERGITEFGKGEPKFHPAGSERFEKLVKDPATKVNYSIYFTLARWEDDDTANIVMPDGFALYRIRTTSYHTVQNLVSEYMNIRKIWKGPFMGIPFELSITQRQGVGPDGKKRSYPVFAFTMKPRKTLEFTSRNLRLALESANRAAAALSLPPPPPAGSDDELPPTTPPAEQGVDDDVLDAEFTPVNPTARDLRDLEDNKDQDAMKRRWFATVKGSHLEPEEARREFLIRHANVESLTSVTLALKPEQFDLLIIQAQKEIEEFRKEEAAKAQLADSKRFHPSVTAADAQLLRGAVAQLGVDRFGIYPLFSMILQRAVTGRPELSREDIGDILDAVGTWGDEGEWGFDEARAGALMRRFDGWRTSDEAGEILLG